MKVGQQQKKLQLKQLETSTWVISKTQLVLRSAFYRPSRLSRPKITRLLPFFMLILKRKTTIK